MSERLDSGGGGGEQDSDTETETETAVAGVDVGLDPGDGRSPTTEAEESEPTTPGVDVGIEPGDGTGPTREAEPEQSSEPGTDSDPEPEPEPTDEPERTETARPRGFEPRDPSRPDPVGDETQIGQRLREQRIEEAIARDDGRFDSEDYRIRLIDGRSVAVPEDEAVADEFARGIADEDDGLEPWDIDVGVDDGEFEATLTEEAIEQQVAQAVAREDDDIDIEDIAGVRETDDGEFEAQLTDEAIERQARAAIASEDDDIDIEDIAGVRETDDGEFEAELTDTAVERLAREEFEASLTDDLRPAGVGLDPGEAIGETQRELAELDADAFDIEIRDGEANIELTGEARRELEPETQQVAREPVEEDSAEPGPAAENIARFAREARDARPEISAALGLTAASLRSESGLPIPGTERTAPGRRDVDEVVTRLEGPTKAVDDAISHAISVAGDQTERVIGDIDVDPARAVSVARPEAAIAGTEAGREGVRMGVERGVQMFNPAAIARDSIRFSDATVRGADAATSEGAEEDIQHAMNVAQGAVDRAPGAAVGTVARSPETAIAAPIAAGTVIAGGVLVGGGAAAGGRAAARGAGRTRAVTGESLTAAQRAGRRAARIDVDSRVPDVRIERDASAGLIEIDGTPIRVAARERARRAPVEIEQSMLRARRNFGERVSRLQDLPTDVRFEVQQRALGAEMAAQRARRDFGELSSRVRDLPTDIQFEAQQAQLAARDRLQRDIDTAFLGDTRTRRGVRDFDARDSLQAAQLQASFEAGRIGRQFRSGVDSIRVGARRRRRDLDEILDGVGDLSTDIDFELSQARQRVEDALETPFITDTATRRDIPTIDAPRLTGAARGMEIDADIALRDIRDRVGRLQDGGLDSAFLSDTRTRRDIPTGRPSLSDIDLDIPRIDTGAFAAAGRGLEMDADIALRDIRRRASDLQDDVLDSAFLSDTRTRRDIPAGRAATDETIAQQIQDTVSQARRRATPDLPSPGEITLRIETPERDRRQVIDVEDLVGPDPADGVPEFVPSGDIATTRQQFDSAVDVGGGQLARIRSEQRTQPTGVAIEPTQRLGEIDRGTDIFGPAFGASMTAGAALDDEIATMAEETDRLADEAQRDILSDFEAASEQTVVQDDQFATADVAAVSEPVALGFDDITRAVQDPSERGRLRPASRTRLRPRTRTRARSRPRRAPALPAFGSDERDDGSAFDFDEADEVFESGIKAADEVMEDVDDLVADLETQVDEWF